MKSWANVTITLGILVIVIAMISGIGTRMSLWDFSFGLSLFMGSVLIALIGGIQGLVGLILSLVRRKLMSIKIKFTLGVVCSVFLTMLFVSEVIASSGYPQIHNVSTDLESPPVFSDEVIALRGNANPTTMSEGLKRTLRSSLPELKPWVSEHQYAVVREGIGKTIDDLGWEKIGVEEDPTGGERVTTFFDTETSFWFGFKDVVAIRLTPRQSGGTIVDVHSVSRVGEVDFGANSERIKRFLQKLEENLGF